MFTENQLKMLLSLVSEKLRLAHTISESSYEYMELLTKYQFHPNFEGDEDNLTTLKQKIEKKLDDRN